MKYSNLKNSLKKKLIAAFTLGFVTVSIMQPVTAKAETTTDIHMAQHPDNILGIAADFGIFVRYDVIASAHNNSNFACSHLSQGTPRSTNITGTKPDGSKDFESINYLNEVTSDIQVDNGYLYLGKGNVSNKIIRNGQEVNTNDGEWNVDGHIVAGSGKMLKEPIVAPNFINLEAEFAKLSTLANNLSKQPEQHIDRARFNDDNNNARTLKCTDAYNVLNLKASDLSADAQGIYIDGIRGNKLLIVNVDMTGVDNLNFQREIFLGEKGTNDAIVNEYDPDASNIIWNFGNFTGTITRHNKTAGIILAPDANVVTMDGLLVGGVIAKNYTHRGSEVHFVPFDRLNEVIVSVTSVNGNCCDDQSKISRSLPGTEFAIFTLDGAEVANTRKTTMAISDNANIARWTVTQPGEYYIQETKTVAGFIQTPIKARFNVEYKDGVLTIDKKIEKEKKLLKEANGYCEAYDNNLDAFKIRHYSDEVIAVAYDQATLKRLVNTTFALVYEDSNNVLDEDGNAITGVTDSEGVFVIHIPKPGAYRMLQVNTDTGYTIPNNCSKFVIYHTPIGQELVVEIDTTFGNEVFEKIQSIYGNPSLMQKITKQFKADVVGWSTGDKADEYEAATDTCIVFYNTVAK